MRSSTLSLACSCLMLDQDIKILPVRLTVLLNRFLEEACETQIEELSVAQMRNLEMAEMLADAQAGQAEQILEKQKALARVGQLEHALAGNVATVKELEQKVTQAEKELAEAAAEHHGRLELTSELDYIARVRNWFEQGQRDFARVQAMSLAGER